MVICQPGGGVCRATFVLIASLTLGACVPVGGPSGQGASAGQAIVQVQGNEVSAAVGADRAHNYVEAMRLWRQIDTEPEVNVAFAGVPLTDDYAPPNCRQCSGFRFGSLFYAKSYASDLVAARDHVGMYYQFGLGVPQDYAEAARWYLKAANTRDITGAPAGLQNFASRNLGLLYAYGLGVQEDRAKARQLWVQPQNIDLVRLLDNNALPKTFEDEVRFNQEVKVAIAKLDQQQALAEQERQKEQAAALERWYRDHPQTVTPSQQGSGSGNSGNRNNCGVLDWAYAPRNMIGGMNLATGCNMKP